MPTQNLTGNKSLDTMLTAAVVALLGWNVWTTNDLGITVGKIETQILLQAEYQQQLYEQRVGRLEQWTDKLSKRLADVEEHLRKLQEKDG